jgi:hypothetical protein
VLGAGTSTRSTHGAARGGPGGKTTGGKTATGGLGGRAATGGGRTLGGAGGHAVGRTTTTRLGSMKWILRIPKPPVRSTGFAFVVPLDPLSKPGEELACWSPAPSAFIGGDGATCRGRSGALGDHIRGSHMRVSGSPSPSTEELDVTHESLPCSEVLEAGLSVMVT